MQTLPFQVRPDLLIEDAEQALAGRLVELSSEVDAAHGNRSLWRGAEPIGLSCANRWTLSSTSVLVMVEDRRLARQPDRPAERTGSLFLRVADFSRLQE
jgi:hypothetical protein